MTQIAQNSDDLNNITKSASTLKTNPTSARSVYSFWIGKLKGVKCNNFCVNKFNKTVESFILPNINDFIRYKCFINDINVELEIINTQNTRLKSLLLEIMDKFENTTLKFVINKIKTLIESTLDLRENNVPLRRTVLTEFSDDTDEEASYEIFHISDSE